MMRERLIYEGGEGQREREMVREREIGVNGRGKWGEINDEREMV